MRPAKQIKKEDCLELESLLKETKSKADFQRVQSIWLRSEFKMTSPEISKAIGLKESTIKVNHHKYFSEGIKSLTGIGRGGRRRFNLEIEEEKHLLDKFNTKASIGGILVVSEIKKAYEDILGKQVPKSTIYRMLERHGWRKIAPRPKHPKNKPEIMEEFKKNSLRSSKKKKG